VLFASGTFRVWRSDVLFASGTFRVWRSDVLFANRACVWVFVCVCFREDRFVCVFRGVFDRLRPARGLKLCRGLIIQLLLRTHQLRR
jgi:hypothetical protein